MPIVELQMLEIPVDYLIYAGCLFGAVVTTWRAGIRRGIVSTLDQLVKEGLLEFAEEDE